LDEATETTALSIKARLVGGGFLDSNVMYANLNEQLVLELSEAVSSATTAK
jgi:hypothetical protein